MAAIEEDGDKRAAGFDEVNECLDLFVEHVVDLLAICACHAAVTGDDRLIQSVRLVDWVYGRGLGAVAAVMDENLIVGLGCICQPVESSQDVGPAGKLLRGFIPLFVRGVDTDVVVG